AAAAPLSPVAAVETSAHARAQDARLGLGRGTRPTERRQWPRSMVERWCVPHAPGASGSLLHAHGAGLAVARATATPACRLNRRMRNRTYGGVRGPRG